MSKSSGISSSMQYGVESVDDIVWWNIKGQTHETLDPDSSRAVAPYSIHTRAYLFFNPRQLTCLMRALHKWK